MLTNETINVFIEDKQVQWDDLGMGIRRKVMAFDESLMVVKVDFQKGAVGKLHHHVHTQISHIHAGVFEVEIAGEKKVLKTGDVFFVPSNVIHGVVCLEAGMLIDIFSPMREDFV